MSCTALAEEQGSEKSKVEVLRVAVWAASGPFASIKAPINAPIRSARPAGRRSALPEIGTPRGQVPGEVSRNMPPILPGSLAARRVRASQNRLFRCIPLYLAYQIKQIVISGPVQWPSEVESFLGVPEERVRTHPIEAQSTAIARAMARICNDEGGVLA